MTREKSNDPQLLENLYSSMLLIRRFEEAATKLLLGGRLSGGVHSSVGQEAVAAGICGALMKNDLISTTHRGHGHCLAKGLDAGQMMAELMGYAEGTNAGRGGSMHISNPEVGVLGANGIVGGGIPLALGAAYAAWVRNSGQVVVSFFGDGAINSGAFHEAMNIASLWKLPIIFVCENNQYAEMTPQSIHSPTTDLAHRASAYAMEGVMVDGNDVLAVYAAAKNAIDRARKGTGPTLIEAKTYRLRGHFEGDPERYKPEGEAEKWAKKDPIRRLKQQLDDTAAIDADIEAKIASAVEFAERGSMPEGTEAMSFVYAES